MPLFLQRQFRRQGQFLWRVGGEDAALVALPPSRIRRNGQGCIGGEGEGDGVPGLPVARQTGRARSFGLCISFLEGKCFASSTFHPVAVGRWRKLVTHI